MNYNPIKGQRWSTKKPSPITAHWIPSKYFIKCSNCGYEIFNSNRIATPRKCPKCDKYMYEVIRRPSAGELLKLAILKEAAEEIMYGKKKEEE